MDADFEGVDSAVLLSAEDEDDDARALWRGGASHGTLTPPAVANGVSRANAAHQSERVHAAATLVQASFRGYWLRSWWAREDAALHVQAVLRGYRVRRDLIAAEEEFAAMRTQAVVRGHLARRWLESDGL